MFADVVSELKYVSDCNIRPCPLFIDREKFPVGYVTSLVGGPADRSGSFELKRNAEKSRNPGRAVRFDDFNVTPKNTTAVDPRDDAFKFNPI